MRSHMPPEKGNKGTVRLIEIGRVHLANSNMSPSGILQLQPSTLTFFTHS